ncbi:MAG: polynucleotide adenylyltransferase PcnB [Gammaproteobacteria bacterium]|nr:polynucleotide adenylyltransferase PcnB [Gammaproteobacteria bacterium]
MPKRITEHNINSSDLDDNALKVVADLHAHDFEAYLVGGCIRDLLCSVKPKDFDVATNATPEQVRSIFRRTRVVGRRFPIAHVRFGRELIEVSTFRQGMIDQVETNEQGLILKDRVFGTIEEDAFRRDFTINALYYDIREEEVLDFVGGMQDLQAKRLRFIGVPAERLAEDPVRMLRAMRFAAKLNFTLDPVLEDFMDDTADRLEEIPSARLFDEFLKMFLSGYGEAVWHLLKETPLARSLFPSCDPDSQLVADAMRNTDERIANEQPVTPGFLVAVLLWEDYQARRALDNPENKPALNYDIAMDTLAVQQQHIAIPRRFSIFVREVWQLQDRLVNLHPRHIQRILHHKRFRAAFDFLCLRGKTDKTLEQRGEWWYTLQFAETATQNKMIDELPKEHSNRRGKRRDHKSPKTSFN